MTRTEQIEFILNNLPFADDLAVQDTVERLRAAIGPTLFETLPEAEQEEIHAALARAQQGQGIPADVARAEFRDLFSVAARNV